MKSLARNLSALTVLLTAGHGAADVIYSGFQNITIPTTYGGTYIDVAGMTFSTSPITTPGWDINPFMGGVYLYNNAAFQPARDGTGGMDTVLNFAAGTPISASGLNFASGSGGSLDHLGTQFTAGDPGYLGFKLNNTNYGWMRVVFTNNSVGAVVKDWAYDNTTGAAITTGNIVQSAPSAGTQTVTLTSATGQAFTLGTQITDSLGNTGGVTNSMVKDGDGTAILTGTNSYSGATTIQAGTLSIAAAASSGSGAVTVNNAGTKLTGAGTVGGNTTINSDAILAPGDAGAGKESFSGNLTLGSTAGSIFEWELAATPAETTITEGVSNRGTDYDAVNVAGTLGGEEAIFRVVLNDSQDFSEAFWDINRTWTDIFTAADNTTAKTDWANAFSSVQYWNTATGSLATPTSQGNFALSGNTLTWTAVPEPTTALAGFLLGAGLLRRRRR